MISWVTTHNCSTETALTQAQMAIVVINPKVKDRSYIFRCRGFVRSKASTERCDSIVACWLTQDMDRLDRIHHKVTDKQYKMENKQF